jgi:hypothetical protein
MVTPYTSNPLAALHVLNEIYRTCEGGGAKHHVLNDYLGFGLSMERRRVQPMTVFSDGSVDPDWAVHWIKEHLRSYIRHGLSLRDQASVMEAVSTVSRELGERLNRHIVVSDSGNGFVHITTFRGAVATEAAIAIKAMAADSDAGFRIDAVKEREVWRGRWNELVLSVDDNDYPSFLGHKEAFAALRSNLEEIGW